MEFGAFFPKRTEVFPLKDYKGHLVKKSSFKGLFEIKDGRTYTDAVRLLGDVLKLCDLAFGRKGPATRLLLSGSIVLKWLEDIVHGPWQTSF